jgi:hypothetical protein
MATHRRKRFCLHVTASSHAPPTDYPFHHDGKLRDEAARFAIFGGGCGADFLYLFLFLWQSRALGFFWLLLVLGAHVLSSVAAQVSCSCGCCFASFDTCSAQSPYPALGILSTLDGTCAGVSCLDVCHYSFGQCENPIYALTTINPNQLITCTAVAPSITANSLTGMWTADHSCDTTAYCCVSSIQIWAFQSSYQGIIRNMLYARWAIRNPGPLCGQDDYGSPPQGYLVSNGQVLSSLVVPTAASTAINTNTAIEFGQGPMAQDAVGR